MEASGLLSLVVFCSLSKLLVMASPEVNDSQQEHHSESHQGEIGVTRNKIVTAQYECFQRILKGSHHRKTGPGPMCNRTWDGWLCWEETEAGFTTEQHCPDYFQNFDTKEMASKICTESGHWGRHPQSNRTWTNYTKCTVHIVQSRMTAMNLFYLVLIGHGLSLTSLFISLGIFFHFKSLSCQRITLHKNLFFSFVLNSVITIIWLTTVANNQEPMHSNSVSCKVIMFIHLYLLSCNYFWMLCEGIYLHTLIVVAVFAEKQHLMWYYLLGWGFPLVPALIHAVARHCYYNDNCWISSDTSLLYIIHSPICAALLWPIDPYFSSNTHPHTVCVRQLHLSSRQSQRRRLPTFVTRRLQAEALLFPTHTETHSCDEHKPTSPPHPEDSVANYCCFIESGHSRI
ncbi:calcitonin gene-related peptide type 1 receptor-like isoform X3 [Lampris incognitus]|uniref:calcitonin gene-related peptide type 1 receptor-like isoform X3 n=1 Tax=Lampris incognitus TaxID=2546036 RepID=UPI0024B5CC00|nr:calcitonin gene-related peptide type 1 receptor-like isoform X3 [Lampris incognitus]